MSPGSDNQRVCFILRIRPDRVDEYRARHTAVWDEMREALQAAGWHNYSLFLTDDGLVIGYLECADFAEAVEAMQQTVVNARWQAEMAPFFMLESDAAPDRAMAPLSEIFHLD